MPRETVRHERQVVYLTELVRGRFPAVLEGHEFDDCEIIGPAVVLPLGNFTMVECDLGGSPMGLLWEIPPQRDEVIGAIALISCEFRNCRFRGVGFAGHPEVIWRILGGSE